MLKDQLNILVADDHSLVRDGLKIALTGLPGLRHIREAGDAAEVRAQLEAGPDINLIILDLQMPGTTDLDLLIELCNSHPGIPIVVLSATENPRTMHRAIEYGAAGFIPKRAANSVLVSALQLVLSGGVYIPSEMFDERSGAPNSAAGEAGAGEIGGSELAKRYATLTDRQRDVIHLLVDGHTNKNIARELGLSEHTVKIHLSSIFRILGVSNRTEAAIACRGLANPDSE